MKDIKESNEYKKVTLANIVFLQDDDYNQYEQDKIRADDNKWDDLEYLLQWYDGDDNHYEQDDSYANYINTPFLGKLIKINGYKGFFLFSKNTSIGYIGLSRLVSFVK